MKKEYTAKAKALIAEGYAPLKILQLLNEDGVSEEDAVEIVEAVSIHEEKKLKSNKRGLIWRAIFIGLLSMILGSLLWAGVALQTGNDFYIVNILIGGLIGYVMRMTSQDMPRRIIPIMAVVFAMVAIFLGDIFFHIIYWYEEFVVEAGTTPFFQYMIMHGFWDTSWLIATNRNLMDIFWMCLSGVAAYFLAK